MEFDMNNFKLNTKNDVLKERYIFGGGQVGLHQFVQLDECHEYPSEDLKPVPFNLASKEKRPREAICHFNIHDYLFESIWNYPGKYIPMLQNFKYVISPDFSAYSEMPMALQIYQFYRRRAMAYYLWLNDVNIIPSAGWGDERTWDWCFDGLPKNSTLAISTNGCHKGEQREMFIKGFRKMCEVLYPERIVCIGDMIDTGIDIETICYKSYGQQMNEKKVKK